jgi:hypothetical protein
MDTPTLNRLHRFPAARITSLPPRILLVTSTTSAAAALVCALQSLPLWIIAVAAILPWLPLLTLETLWTARISAWLALFYVLAVTQSGHVVEHIAQMVQIHLLGKQPLHAHGIFGALDIEWVHVLWNSWVALAILALLLPFRRNAWLWSAALIALWHEIEHLYIMSVYLTTGQVGDPGLLSRGGELGGGVALIRPDLHFLYNLIETTPLVIAFVVQWRSTQAAAVGGRPTPGR